ncbi:MAG: hypothetical protein ACLFTR_02070 [Candidatus Woesearchaeota archaeon]
MKGKWKRRGMSVLFGMTTSLFLMQGVYASPIDPDMYLNEGSSTENDASRESSEDQQEEDYVINDRLLDDTPEDDKTSETTRDSFFVSGLETILTEGKVDIPFHESDYFELEYSLGTSTHKMRASTQMDFGDISFDLQGKLTSPSQELSPSISYAIDADISVDSFGMSYRYAFDRSSKSHENELRLYMRNRF